MTRISGNPDALTGYSHAMLALLPRLRAAVDDYALTIGVYNLAPNGSSARSDDLSARARHEVELLDQFDRLPAAMADALRTVDWLWPEGPPAETAGSSSGELFDTLVDARLQDPLARPFDLVLRARRIMGERAAGRVGDLLRSLGIDPSRFDPAHLRSVDPAKADEYRRLVDELEALGRRLEDPDVAAGVVATLGPQGVRSVVGVLEELDLHQRQRGNELFWDRAGFPQTPPPDLGDRTGRTLGRFVDGFARVSGDASLAALRHELLHPAQAWQQHQLAVLMGGPPSAYDPAFLAAGARVVLLTDRVTTPAPAPLPTEYQPLYYDDRLTSGAAEAVAVRALAGNAEATRRFVVADDGGVRRPELRVLAEGGHNLYADDSARALGHLVLGSRSNPVYTALIQEVAAGGASVETKRLAARALVLYIDTLGHGAQLQLEANSSPLPADRPAFDLRRQDLIAFFGELGDDPTSVMAVAAGLTAFGAVVVDSIRPDQPRNTPEQDEALRHLALVLGAVEKGYDQSTDRRVEQERANVSGVRLVLGAAATTPAGLSPYGPGWQIVAFSTGFAANQLLQPYDDAAVQRALAQAPSGLHLQQAVYAELLDRLAGRLDSKPGGLGVEDRTVIDRAFVYDPLLSLSPEASERSREIPSDLGWDANRAQVADR